MELLEKSRSKGTHIRLALQLLALLLQTVHSGAKVYSDIIDYPQKCNYTKLMCNESRLLEEDKIIILNIANEMRNRVAGGSFGYLNLKHDPVSNMNKLLWNQELEEKAASLVSSCPKTSLSFISEETEILPGMDGMDYIKIKKNFDQSTYKLDDEMPGCEVSTITYKEKLTLCAPQKIKERLIGYLTEGGLSAEARKYDMRDFWMMNRYGEPRLTFRRAESTDVGCSYLIRAGETHYFSYLTCIHCIYNFTIPIIGHPGEMCSEEFQHFDEKYENLCSDLRNEYDGIKKDQNEVVCKVSTEMTTYPTPKHLITKHSTTTHNISTTNEKITSSKAASQKTTTDTKLTDFTYNTKSTALVCGTKSTHGGTSFAPKTKSTDSFNNTAWTTSMRKTKSTYGGTSLTPQTKLTDSLFYTTMTASVPKKNTTHDGTSQTLKISIQSTSMSVTKSSIPVDKRCNDTGDSKILPPHCNQTESKSSLAQSSVTPLLTEPTHKPSCQTTIIKTSNTFYKQYNTTPLISSFTKTHLPITSSTESIVTTQLSQHTKDIGTNCSLEANENALAPLCKSSSSITSKKPTISTLFVNYSIPQTTKFFNTKETSYEKLSKISITTTPLPSIFTTCRKTTTASTAKHSNLTPTAIHSTNKHETSIMRKTSPTTASIVIKTVAMSISTSAATSKKNTSVLTDLTTCRKTTPPSVTNKLNITTTSPISTTAEMTEIITLVESQNNKTLATLTQKEATASTVDIPKTTPVTKFKTSHNSKTITCNKATTLSNSSFISSKTTHTYLIQENISTSSSNGTTLHSVKTTSRRTTGNINLESPSTKLISPNTTSIYFTTKMIFLPHTNATTIHPITKTCKKTTATSHTTSNYTSAPTFSTTRSSSSTKFISHNITSTYFTTKNITSSLRNGTKICPITATCRKTTTTTSSIPPISTVAPMYFTTKIIISKTTPPSTTKFILPNTTSTFTGRNTTSSFANTTKIHPITTTCRKTTVTPSITSTSTLVPKRSSYYSTKFILPITTSTHFISRNITSSLTNSTTMRPITTTCRKTTETSSITSTSTAAPTHFTTKSVISMITPSSSIKFSVPNTTSTYFTTKNITFLQNTAKTCRKTTGTSYTTSSYAYTSTFPTTKSISSRITSPTIKFVSPNTTSTYFTTKNITLPLTNATTRSITTTCRKTTATSSILPISTAASTYFTTKHITSKVIPPSSTKIISPNTTSTQFTAKNISLPLTNATAIYSSITTCRKTATTPHTTFISTFAPKYSTAKNITSSSNTTTICSNASANRNITAPICTTFISSTSSPTHSISRHMNSTRSSTTFMKTSNFTARTTYIITEERPKTIIQSMTSTTKCRKTIPTIIQHTENSTIVLPITKPTFIPTTRSTRILPVTTAKLIILTSSSTKATKSVMTSMKLNITSNSSQSTCKKTTTRPTAIPTITVPFSTESIRFSLKNITSSITPHSTNPTTPNITVTKSITLSTKRLNMIYNMTISSTTPKSESATKSSYHVSTENVTIFSTSTTPEDPNMTTRSQITNATKFTNKYSKTAMDTRSMTSETNSTKITPYSTTHSKPKSTSVEMTPSTTLESISKGSNNTHFTFFTTFLANITNSPTTTELLKHNDTSTSATSTSISTTGLSIFSEPDENAPMTVSKYTTSSSSSQSTFPSSTLPTSVPTEKTIQNQRTTTLSTFLCDPCRTADGNTKKTSLITLKPSEFSLTSRSTIPPVTFDQEIKTKNTPQMNSHDPLSTKSEFRQKPCVCVNWYMIGLIFIVAFLFAWCLICWQRLLLF